MKNEWKKEILKNEAKNKETETENPRQKKAQNAVRNHLNRLVSIIM